MLLIVPIVRRRVSVAMVDTLADLARHRRRSARPVPSGSPRALSNGRFADGPSAGTGRRSTTCPEMECARGVAARAPAAGPGATGRRSWRLQTRQRHARRHDLGPTVAVFDWEMSALGDPLVDLGIFLAYWTHAKPVSGEDALSSVTDRPGWMTRNEIVERYAEQSGRSCRWVAVFRSVRSLQNRRCHSADLLPLSSWANRRSAVRTILGNASCAWRRRRATSRAVSAPVHVRAEALWRARDSAARWQSQV